MHVKGDAVVDHRKDESAYRRVDRSQPLLTKSVPENSLETKLSANPNVNLLTRVVDGLMGPTISLAFIII